MTIQDLIDELNKIEDKNKLVLHEYDGPDAIVELPVSEVIEYNNYIVIE